MVVKKTMPIIENKTTIKISIDEIIKAFGIKGKLIRFYVPTRNKDKKLIMEMLK